MLNWIKRKIKWVLIITGIIGIALASTLIPAEQTEPVGATIITTKTEIQDKQNIYFAKNGHYMQVMKGNKLPEYSKEKSVLDGFGKNIKANQKIDIWEKPDGTKGFTILELTDEPYQVITATGTDNKIRQIWKKL